VSLAAGPTGDVVTADPQDTRAALTQHRPDLVAGYDAALPGARAQILSRLLGALHREPLPGVTGRRPDRSRLHIGLADGRTLDAPADAAAPFADPPDGLTARLDGTDHDDPGTLIRALGLPGHTARLATEVDNSVANLALAHARPAGVPTLAGLAGDPDGPGRAEQSVIDGHPLHPCCRTRGGMSVADVLAYAPEHAPVLRLHRLRVPADRWYGDAPPVLLAHPWQAQRLKDRHPWLTGDGETAPVRPLMSLRTVAPLDGGDHVKTAVDVQLTSAVRTVSPAAVHNGPRLSSLLATLTADLPLDVLTEYAAGAVLVDGHPHRSLAHLRRAAPPTAPGQVSVPLAALTAGRGRPLLDAVVAAHARDPYAWLTALTAVLVPPMLTVLHRGVALEAHGQNTLVVLRGGRPVRILYRDLGGIRVSTARLRAHGVESPPLHGDLPCDDPTVLRSKLAATLFGTVLAEQVTLLTRRHGAEAARCWEIIAAAVRRVGTPDVRTLLRDPVPVKATTAMRLADDPLSDIWAWQDNPMAGLG
jgi:siderophore synthetase component